MPQPDDRNAVYMPLFSALWAIARGEHDDVRHFNTGTLFWSLTRLFGCYERVMSVLHLPRDARPFLDADVESFIIRFRIVMNDLAYAVRLLMPQHARGLSAPTGETHPKNREMSVFKLANFLQSNSHDYPEFSTTFARATPWMTRLKNDRDSVIHYKAMVEIFEGDPLTFALSNAAGTERRKPRVGGGTKRSLEPVGEFVNDQLLSLYSFMNEELLKAIEAHATRYKLKLGPGGSGFHITGPGIARFRATNDLR